MAEPLSYQRLLELTAALGPGGQEYVLRFVTSNDRKAREARRKAQAAEAEYRYWAGQLRDGAFRKLVKRLNGVQKRLAGRTPEAEALAGLAEEVTSLLRERRAT